MCGEFYFEVIHEAHSGGQSKFMMFADEMEEQQKREKKRISQPKIHSYEVKIISFGICDDDVGKENTTKIITMNKKNERSHGNASIVNDVLTVSR